MQVSSASSQCPKLPKLGLSIRKRASSEAQTHVCVFSAGGDHPSISFLLLLMQVLLTAIEVTDGSSGLRLELTSGLSLALAPYAEQVTLYDSISHTNNSARLASEAHCHCEVCCNLRP